MNYCISRYFLLAEHIRRYEATQQASRGPIMSISYGIEGYICLFILGLLYLMSYERESVVDPPFYFNIIAVQLIDVLFIFYLHKQGSISSENPSVSFKHLKLSCH